MAKEISVAGNNASLVNVVSFAIQLPGVKVSRETFLQEQFRGEPKKRIEDILVRGPVEAGCEREIIRKKAQALINDRTVKSTGASFIAGLPGGLAMAATIPADMLQYYAVALRLAQEIAYLYGEGDLWNGEMLDKERITNQLILYCGVMLGSSGAAQTVRVMSSALAKQALKKIPQKALTKTFYYPIVTSIAKAFGAKMTKNVFAKGVSKAVPLIGGVISGGITFATMKPMGTRLMDAMDEAKFAYTQKGFEADWNDIVEICEAEFSDPVEVQLDETMSEESVLAESVPDPETDSMSENSTDIEELMRHIGQAKQLLDSGIISESEFAKIKARLIEKM